MYAIFMFSNNFTCFPIWLQTYSLIKTMVWQCLIYRQWQIYGQCSTLIVLPLPLSSCAETPKCIYANVKNTGPKSMWEYSWDYVVCSSCFILAYLSIPHYYGLSPLRVYYNETHSIKIFCLRTEENYWCVPFFFLLINHVYWGQPIIVKPWQ